jgi:hypothetical protein
MTRKSLKAQVNTTKIAIQCHERNSATVRRRSSTYARKKYSGQNSCCPVGRLILTGSRPSATRDPRRVCTGWMRTQTLGSVGITLIRENQFLIPGRRICNAISKEKPTLTGARWPLKSLPKDTAKTLRT